MGVCAALAGLVAIAAAGAQDAPPIRVPVRLVTVPTLVLGPDNRPLADLDAGQFRLYDEDRPRAFALDTSAPPLSIVIAVQANTAVRAYLPFIARVGSALEALLVGNKGEAAVVFYGDDV